MEESQSLNTSQLLDRERQLAETYKNGADRVREYRAATQWHAAHPQQGSYAASQALELPRGRLRTWFEGGKPDAQHAIDTAESHGWIDAVPGEPTFEGLSLLHAWVLAGGSISRDTYSPSFAAGPSDPTELAREALNVVGIPPRVVNAASTKRAQELRPSGQGGSHLGRFLHGVLGAPIGDKTRMGVEPLEYLASVPRETLRRWCRTYTTLRGVSIDSDRERRTVRVGEQRSQAYRKALADIFREVVDEDANITVTQRSILLGTDTLNTLDVVPTLPSSG